MKGTPSGDWLVGKKAVANALGVSVSTVKRYLKRYPDFPANRRGGTIYVSPMALAAWVEDRAIKKCPTCGIAIPS
jgi:transposase